MGKHDELRALIHWCDAHDVGTREQREKAQAVLDHGSHRKAAESLGLNHSTIDNAVNRLKKAAADRGWITKEDEQNSKAIEAENKALRQEIDRLAEQYERQLKATFTLPRAPAANPKGLFRRLVIPDTHGSSIAKDAAAAMLRDAAQLDVREVVLLGDHVDCAGFLAQHHANTYVSQTGYTFEDDVAAGNVFLDEVQAACPKARIYYLEGNHERRVEAWCVQAALSRAMDAELLLRALSPARLLNLEKRGIEYIHTLDASRGNGKARSVLQLGKCLFLHGYSHAKNAPEKTLNDYARSVCMGHIHRRQSFTRTTYDSEISAWCDGCLCELRQYYIHARPSHHAHGYGIQTVADSGLFIHQQVPIIDGQSLLLS